MSAPSQDIATLAAEAREEGRWGDAAMLYGVLVKATPNDPDTICWHGYSLWQSGDLERAIAEYARAEPLAPKWSGINNCLGTINRELGNTDEAIAQYRLAIKKSPYYAEAHANLAETLWRLGRLSEATTHYRRAIEATPEWDEIYDDLARILCDQGLFAEASMVIREGIRLQPDALDMQLTYASILSQQDKHDEAEARLLSLLRTAQNDSSLWSRLGWVRWRAKKYGEAATAAQRATALDPKLPYPHFLLGGVASKNEDRDAAIAHYRRYLELDPEDYEGAALALSHLGAAAAPDKASESYMKQLYATRSSFWDDNVDSETQYGAPTQITDALTRFMGRQTGLDIMDVGCGTGLCGPLLRERAKRLDGLDLSSYMLEKAREKSVYDELIEGDLEKVLYDRREKYDVIASAATLIHFGDLLAPLKACAAALRPGGWMSFTVFPSKDGVAVLPFFCHAHSPDHVRERAEQAGFDVISIDEQIHEYHHGKPVPGLVVVLRKKGAAA